MSVLVAPEEGVWATGSGTDSEVPRSAFEGVDDIAPGMAGFMLAPMTAHPIESSSQR